MIQSTTISVSTQNYVQGELFRFDKNFANNMEQVSQLVDDGGGLLRSVLYYLADSYQHNILSIGLFDVEDFAGKYGFSVNFLRKPHPNPFHLHNMSKADVDVYHASRTSAKWDVSDRKVWDSYIENALYVLMARPLTFDVIGGAFKIDKSVYKMTGGCQVLKSLSAVYVGRRLYYRYVMNEDFMRNLSSYYANVDRRCLVSTRSTNLDVLYLAVGELKTAVGLAGETRTAGSAVSFSRLCELAKVPEKTRNGNDVPKREQKRLVNKAFETLNALTDINCRLCWEKEADSDYAYSPYIVFDEKEMSALSPGSGVRKMRERNAVNDVLKDNLLREFYKAFCEINREEPCGDDIEECYARWFFSSPANDPDRVARSSAFRNACLHAFNRYPDGVDGMFEIFLKKSTSAEETDVRKFLDRYILESRS